MQYEPPSDRGQAASHLGQNRTGTQQRTGALGDGALVHGGGQAGLCVSQPTALHVHQGRYHVGCTLAELVPSRPGLLGGSRPVLSVQ